LDHRRGARELFTRLDTGQRCSASFAAGLSNAAPPSLSQDAKIFGVKDKPRLRACQTWKLLRNVLPDELKPRRGRGFNVFVHHSGS
jgi:hypothetical protein